MTDYPTRTLDADGAAPTGRHVSWEQRLSKARARRQKVIAHRDEAQPKETGAGSTAAVKELAAMLRGAEDVLTDPTPPDFEPDEPSARGLGPSDDRTPATAALPPGAGRGITPERLAHARRLREEAIAAREPETNLAREPEAHLDKAPEANLDKTPAAQQANGSKAHPEIVFKSATAKRVKAQAVADGTPPAPAPAVSPQRAASAAAAASALQAAPALARPVAPMRAPMAEPSQQRRRSGLFGFLVVLILGVSLGFGAVSDQAAPLRAWLQSVVDGVMVSEPSVPVPQPDVAPGPEAMGPGPVITGGSGEALARFWAPNARRAVLPLVATSLSGAAPEVALAAPVPLAPSQPDVTGPDVVGPEVTGSEVAGPDATAPDATAPDVTDAVFTAAPVSTPDSDAPITALTDMPDRFEPGAFPASAFDPFHALQAGMPFASEPVARLAEAPLALRQSVPVMAETGPGLAASASFAISAPPAPPLGTGRTLIIETSDAHANFAELFAAQGFEAIEVTVTSFEFSTPQVHFFHESDRGTADYLAAALRGESVALLGLNNAPPAGTLRAYHSAH